MGGVPTSDPAALPQRLGGHPPAEVVERVVEMAEAAELGDYARDPIFVTLTITVSTKSISLPISNIGAN